MECRCDGLEQAECRPDRDPGIGTPGMSGRSVELELRKDKACMQRTIIPM